MQTHIRAFLLVAATAFAPAAFTAESELSGQGILSVAKMAGACGIMDSLIQFQKTTKMAGGEEFVTRFWEVEAARLGMSVKQYSDQCNGAISGYGKLWDAAESSTK